MYDAIEDPYTYKNSTVLVNKLGLRSQAELDAFEAEISNARAEEPLPNGAMDFELRRAAIHSAFPKISKTRRASCSMTCARRIIYGISIRRYSRIGRRIFWLS